MNNESIMMLMLFLNRYKKHKPRAHETANIAHGFLALYLRVNTHTLWRLYSKAPDYIKRAIYTARKYGIIDYNEFSALLSVSFELINDWDIKLAKMYKESKEEKL